MTLWDLAHTQMHLFYDVGQLHANRDQKTRKTYAYASRIDLVLDAESGVVALNGCLAPDALYHSYAMPLQYRYYCPYSLSTTHNLRPYGIGATIPTLSVPRIPYAPHTLRPSGIGTTVPTVSVPLIPNAPTASVPHTTISVPLTPYAPTTSVPLCLCFPSTTW
eukprot:3215574-Rhodomonas_salina.2